MAAIEVNSGTGNPGGPIYDTYAGAFAAAGASDIIMETGGFVYNEGGLAVPANGVSITSLPALPSYPAITKNIGTLIDVGNRADVIIERTSFLPTANAGVQRVITAGAGADRCIVQDCDFENTVAQVGEAFYVSGAVATPIQLRRLTMTNLLYAIQANASPTQMLVSECVSRDCVVFYMSNGSGFWLDRIDHEGGALCCSGLAGNTFLWLNTDLIPHIVNCRAYGTPGAGKPMVGCALTPANPTGVVYHNTIVDDGPGVGDAVKAGLGVGAVLHAKNNIAWGFPNSFSAAVALDADYNQTDGAFVGGCGAGANNGNANPAFLLATDHSIGTTSPCADTAVGGLGVTVDGRGASRPQGAGPDRGWWEAIPPHQKGGVGVYSTGASVTIRMIETHEPTPETEEV